MRPAWLYVALASLPALGCSEGVDPSAFKGGVQVSFATQAPAAAPAPGALPAALAPAGDTIRSGNNTLVIDKVEMILREIELERVETLNCDTQPAGCEDVEVGPVLIGLPLGAAVQQKLAVQIPVGSYDEVEFEVHKLSASDSRDAQLLQVRPDFIDLSIKVEGTFDGRSFTYKTDLDVKQELKLVPPLVVSGPSTSTNLTIRVLLADWFRSASGGLLDPATGNKGGINESLIQDNIKKSMKAFEDRDRDGKEG